VGYTELRKFAKADDGAIIKIISFVQSQKVNSSHTQK